MVKPLVGDSPIAYRAKKSEYKNIFSAPSSRPLIGRSDTTLESREHEAISELSGPPIKGLENFHFLYGDSSERVILKNFTPILHKKNNQNFRIF